MDADRDAAVDVVVVTHNSAARLDDALRPLPPDAKTFVVDNASTDQSATVARNLGATVVVNDVNAGFASAANQGAALGSADVIVFLNPDASIEEPDLARLVEALASRPNLGLAAPRITDDDGREQRVAWPFPSARGAWLEAIGARRVLRPAAPGFLIGASLAVRRRAFETLGGFDTRYWLYGEDADLCRRARDAGWQLEVVGAATARHSGGASGRDSGALVRDHFERGSERFVRDHAGALALVGYRVANLVGASIRAALPGDRVRRQLHRRRMGRGIRELATHALHVPLDNPVSERGDHSLVVCSLESWDQVWRRNQHLVHELTRRDPHLRVLFVEPAFDRLHDPLTGRRRRRRGLRAATPDGRVLTIEPTKLLPRVVGPFADTSLRRQVLRAIRRAGLSAPRLWINDTAYASLATGGWPLLYDITDDWIAAPAAARIRRRRSRDERRLLHAADVVTVCSDVLADTRRGLRPDVVVVSNAADVELISAPVPRPRDLPAPPVATYVGTLHEDRLDVELVAALAVALPHVAVVLVGPNALRARSNARLAAVENVHLLGPRSHEQVAAYLQHADVLIVPHLVTDFTESLDPIKAYECLAAGRPTIATPVPGFRERGEPILVVPADCFVETVARIVADPPAHRPVLVPTWGERAEAFAVALAAAERDHRRD